MIFDTLGGKVGVGAGAYCFAFNGKEVDDEGEWGNSTTAYDYGFRIYNPQVARFLSVDPLGYEMPNWSVYSYAFDSPLSFIDPDGRKPLRCCDPPLTEESIYFDAGQEMQIVAAEIFGVLDNLAIEIKNSIRTTFSISTNVTPTDGASVSAYVESSATTTSQPNFRAYILDHRYMDEEGNLYTPTPLIRTSTTVDTRLVIEGAVETTKRGVELQAKLNAQISLETGDAATNLELSAGQSAGGASVGAFVNIYAPFNTNYTRLDAGLQAQLTEELDSETETSTATDGTTTTTSTTSTQSTRVRLSLRAELGDDETR